jgi:large subunit ribosomal protein L17
MRHQCKIHKLSLPKDQRTAVLRSLATELFVHGEINTTMSRAKALQPYAEKIISLAKKGDLSARRQAGRYIFDKETGIMMESADKKQIPQTVLRKLFTVIGEKYSSREGGYTRIYRMPPRRGDAVEMALIQLV